MKKLLNEPGAYVDGMLDGLVAAHSEDLRRLGCARMFAEKTIGIDDRGMVGVLRMVEAIQD